MNLEREYQAWIAQKKQIEIVEGFPCDLMAKIRHYEQSKSTSRFNSEGFFTWLFTRPLAKAGLTVTATEVVALVNAAFDPNTYSAHLIDVIAAYTRPHLGDDTVDAWAGDLRELAERGEYFFSINRYLFAARAAA